MTTIVIMFAIGYVFHLLYKCIDNVFITVKRKTNEKKGMIDE